MNEDETELSIEDIKKKIPPIDLQKNRYKYYGSYKIDRWLIQASMFLIFGWLFFIAYSYNFDMNYFECSNMDVTYSCKNPFYKPTTWINEPYLPIGEYGTKLGPLYNSAKPVTISILILAFFINHLIYNRGGKNGN